MTEKPPSAFANKLAFNQAGGANKSDIMLNLEKPGQTQVFGGTIQSSGGDSSAKLMKGSSAEIHNPLLA